jgi:hypothetical protein
MTEQISQEAERMVIKEHTASRKEFQIRSERADDSVVLLGMMMRMDLPEVLDNHIPVHWKQRELRWGWTAVIWLAYRPPSERLLKAFEGITLTLKFTKL